MSNAARARALRRKSTWAEKSLWRLLRSRRLAGYKFRRQHPVSSYFLDFFCLEAGVAVESDGSGHGFPGQQRLDVERDAYLATQGIIVKRIWNSHLARRREREAFVESLWQLLQERS